MHCPLTLKLLAVDGRGAVGREVELRRRRSGIAALAALTLLLLLLVCRLLLTALRLCILLLLLLLLLLALLLSSWRRCRSAAVGGGCCPLVCCWRAARRIFSLGSLGRAPFPGGALRQRLACKVLHCRCLEGGGWVSWAAWMDGLGHGSHDACVKAAIALLKCSVMRRSEVARGPPCDRLFNAPLHS